MLIAGAGTVEIGDCDGIDTDPLLPAEPGVEAVGTGEVSERPGRLPRVALLSDAEDPLPALGMEGESSSLLSDAALSEVDVPEVELSPEVETELSRPPRVPRAELREEALVESVAASADDASEVDPPEPLESAKAIGIAAMPDPTPSATASAPTRPT